MKINLLFLLLVILAACSGDIDKGQAPANKINVIESPSTNFLKSQNDINEEHISGNGEIIISGAPSSSNISGQ